MRRPPEKERLDLNCGRRTSQLKRHPLDSSDRGSVPILSVDLASGDYSDIGLVALERVEGTVVIAPIQLGPVGLRGRPEPAALAEFLRSLAAEIGASAIGLDGPQGWKDVNNGCEHSRVCEARLRTQGKTGLPGNTKPGNYLGFIQFCISTFDELERGGWRRLRDTRGDGGPTAIETFPTAAWRAVGLRPLPGKATAKEPQVRSWTESLLQLGGLRVSDQLSHDELQAAISGLGILALAEQRIDRFEAVGQPPFEMNGVWFEGYIVNPRNWNAAV